MCCIQCLATFWTTTFNVFSVYNGWPYKLLNLQKMAICALKDCLVSIVLMFYVPSITHFLQLCFVGFDGDEYSKNGKKTTETMTLRKEGWHYVFIVHVKWKRWYEHKTI